MHKMCNTTIFAQLDQLSRHGQVNNYSRYDWTPISSKHFAPAAFQALVSSLISVSKRSVVRSSRLKTLLFLSFHIVHVVSMISERSALSLFPRWFPVSSLNHSCNSASCVHDYGESDCCPIQVATLVHDFWASVHSLKRCIDVSKFLQQSGHK